MLESHYIVSRPDLRRDSLSRDTSQLWQVENILKISVGKEEGGAVKSCKNCIHISYTSLSHQHNDADSREGEYMGVKYDYFQHQLWNKTCMFTQSSFVTRYFPPVVCTICVLGLVDAEIYLDAHLPFHICRLAGSKVIKRYSPIVWCIPKYLLDVKGTSNPNIILLSVLEFNLYSNCML